MGTTRPINHPGDPLLNPARLGKNSAIRSAKDPPGLHTSQPGHLHASPGSDPRTEPCREIERSLKEAVDKLAKDIERTMKEFTCEVMKALEASLRKAPAKKRSRPAPQPSASLVPDTHHNLMSQAPNNYPSQAPTAQHDCTLPAPGEDTSLTPCLNQDSARCALSLPVPGIAFHTMTAPTLGHRCGWFPIMESGGVG